MPEGLRTVQHLEPAVLVVRIGAHVRRQARLGVDVREEPGLPKGALPLLVDVGEPLLVPLLREGDALAVDGGARNVVRHV